MLIVYLKAHGPQLRGLDLPGQPLQNKLNKYRDHLQVRNINNQTITALKQCKNYLYILSGKNVNLLMNELAEGYL